MKHLAVKNSDGHFCNYSHQQLSMKQHVLLVTSTNLMLDANESWRGPGGETTVSDKWNPVWILLPRVLYLIQYVLFTLLLWVVNSCFQCLPVRMNTTEFNSNWRTRSSHLSSQVDLREHSMNSTVRNKRVTKRNVWRIIVERLTRKLRLHHRKSGLQQFVKEKIPFT